MSFTKFTTAFKKYATSPGNVKDGDVNWNFVDADLHLDGWGDKLGNNYVGMFNKCADDFELTQSLDRLTILKTDFLGQ
jgi:hypothetical protein